MTPDPALDRYFGSRAPVGPTPPLATVLIDAEEDFDWLRPQHGEPFNVDCMRHLTDFQAILAAYQAVPTYLLTYPVLQDEAIVLALRGRLARGQCRLGIQLHPWVTPPFDEPSELTQSFAGNLPPGLEALKIRALMRQFAACFGENPVVFRAGRYGLSPQTAALLEENGFTVDTSLAPCTSFANEAGPDFAASDFNPFWFGRSRHLLELPLCRSIAGWAGDFGRHLYQRHAAEAGTDPHGPFKYLPMLLARSRAAERITLSPEGNDPSAAARLVASLRHRDANLLALSLHSSSLSIGRNPYVRDKAGLHHFYDRLSAMLDMLVSQFSVGFVAAPDLPGRLRAGSPHG